MVNLANLKDVLVYYRLLMDFRLIFCGLIANVIGTFGGLLVNSWASWSYLLHLSLHAITLRNLCYLVYIVLIFAKLSLGDFWWNLLTIDGVSAWSCSNFTHI